MNMPKLCKNPIVEYDGTDSFIKFMTELGLKVEKLKFSSMKIVKVVPDMNGIYQFRLPPHYFSIPLDDLNFEEIGARVVNHVMKDESDLGTLKLFSLSNRRGLCFVLTNHDHPVNGKMFVVTPCAESKVKKWA